MKIAAMADMFTEEWRPVPGFEGLYWVSDQGRVKGPRKYLSPQPNNKGYWQVRLYRYRSLIQEHLLVHRLVCHAFHGAPPSPDYQVHHKDKDTANNSAANLEWRLPEDNRPYAVEYDSA